MPPMRELKVDLNALNSIMEIADKVNEIPARLENWPAAPRGLLAVCLLPDVFRAGDEID